MSRNSDSHTPPHVYVVYRRVRSPFGKNIWHWEGVQSTLVEARKLFSDSPARFKIVKYRRVTQ